MDTPLKYWLRSLVKTAKHSYSTTQVMVPSGPLRDAMLALGRGIPDEDLYDDDGSKGRESEPHITVRYGITDTIPDKVVHAVSHTGPVRVKLGPVSVFSSNPSYDVLKLDVDSPALHRLNSLVDANVPFRSDYPDYHPHLTLAYVRKGKGNSFIGKEPFKGIRFAVHSMQFRNPLDERTDIPLLDPSKSRQYLKDELLELTKEMKDVRLPS